MSSLTEYEWAGSGAGLVFKFEYVGAKDNAGRPRSVEFYAYLKSYSDSFSPQWDKKPVFGRTDPIVNYKSTGRQIKFGLDIPAKDLAQSRDNLHKLEKLASFVYPVINSQNSLDTFSRKPSAQFQAPPILRLSFCNIARDYETSGGLYGFIDSSIDINWQLEHGAFISSGSSDIEPDVGKITRIYPKIVDISITYQVLHNHAVGWDVASTRQFLDAYGFLRAPPESMPVDGNGFSDDPTKGYSMAILPGVTYEDLLEDQERNTFNGDLRDARRNQQEWVTRRPTVGNKINPPNQPNNTIHSDKILKSK